MPGFPASSAAHVPIRSIRIDAEILAALEAQAKKERRSVNNLIEVVLSRHLDVSEGWLE